MFWVFFLLGVSYFCEHLRRGFIVYARLQSAREIYIQNLDLPHPARKMYIQIV